MNIKRKLIPKLLYLIIAYILFLIGNRIGYLFISTPELVGIDLFLFVSNNILSSFLPSRLGLYISYDPTPLMIGVFLVILTLLGVSYYRSLQNRHNYLPNAEHGSSRLANIETEGKRLKNADDKFDNTILSQNIQLDMNTFRTFLNNNIFVIGGSGSGKTRYFIKPNVLQMKWNLIITDPKGSLLPEIGHALEENGYDIKVLNLVHMEQSMRYNPFKYITKPEDVYKFVNNLVNNTNKEGGKQGGDQFFEDSEIMLLSALFYFILAVGDEDEKNMNMVLDLIDLAESDLKAERESVLDIMFADLEDSMNKLYDGKIEKNDYAYLAIRSYRLFKKAPPETAMSILISVGVRMSIFYIPAVGRILSDDDMDLESIAEPKKDKNGNYIKTALFLIISDNDSVYSFLAGILIQQLFDILYSIADNEKDNKLPIPVRFFLDEFANLGYFKDIERKVSTMRSRNISIAIVLQELGQIQGKYEKTWKSIFGNCDTTLFLGGKEPETLEYISKLIGNTTIDYLSISESKGSNSDSWSKTNQLISRPLIAPDEIGRLPSDQCLIHIRGEHIFKDRKFVLGDHDFIYLTTDTKSKDKVEENRFNLQNYLNKKQLQASSSIDEDVENDEPTEHLVQLGDLTLEDLQTQETISFSSKERETYYRYKEDE